MQFLQCQAQEHNLQCQTVSKNKLWGWTFKAFKMSGNWGYLIKRPPGQQSVKVFVNENYSYSIDHEKSILGWWCFSPFVASKSCQYVSYPISQLGACQNFHFGRICSEKEGSMFLQNIWWRATSLYCIMSEKSIVSVITAGRS